VNYKVILQYIIQGQSLVAQYDPVQGLYVQNIYESPYCLTVSFSDFSPDPYLKKTYDIFCGSIILDPKNDSFTESIELEYIQDRLTGAIITLGSGIYNKLVQYLGKLSYKEYNKVYQGYLVGTINLTSLE